MAKKKAAKKSTAKPKKDRVVKEIRGNKVRILTADEAEEWRKDQ